MNCFNERGAHGFRESAVRETTASGSTDQGVRERREVSV